MPDIKEAIIPNIDNDITTNKAQKSAEKQRELNEAIAKSAAQAALTQSSIDIEIADNKGKSELRLAEQLALKTQKLAEADKYKRSGSCC